MKKILVLSFLISILLCNNVLAQSQDVGTQACIDNLAMTLNSYQKSKKTFLGFVSSAKGISLVKEINAVGEPVIIATSKNAYCIMKKLSDGTNYCVSSGGFMGTADGCSKTNISCLSFVKNDREKLISKIRALITERSMKGVKVEKFLSVIKSGDLQKVKQMIGEGVDVNGEISGEVPLMLGAKTNLEIVNELIKAGANVNWKDDYGYTAMYYSANIDIMKALIKAGTDYKGDVSIRTIRIPKKIPFLSAMLLNVIYNKDLEMVKELISLGADVNATMYDSEGREYKNAPMKIADIEGYKEILEELKKAGAETIGETPEWVSYRALRDYTISNGAWFRLTR
ncbi:MAG: ankyrin repeat domain-containing protein [Candidatus Pacebacteria bacterium]|nr:ankyrin repeat domain-containing protein [Candidatus Paceibacterota bacterium]